MPWPRSWGTGFSSLCSAPSPSCKWLLTVPYGRPHCSFALPFCFSWHLSTCWGHGSLCTKANCIFSGREWEKQDNLSQENRKSVCLLAAAPLPHHKALPWLPSWGWAAPQPSWSALVIGPCFATKCKHHNDHLWKAPQTSWFPFQSVFVVPPSSLPQTHWVWAKIGAH